MSRHRPRRRIHPVGAIPGALESAQSQTAVVTTMFAFGPDRFVEKVLPSLNDIVAQRDGLPMLWLNFDRPPDAQSIEQLQKQFGLPPLALEDVLHPTQRAKVEPFGPLLFLVIPMPMVGDESFRTEQLAIFVGPNFVITIQQHEGGDCLECIRRRIRSREGRVREKGSAYLTFALIDAVIDQYFPLVYALGERLDAVEEIVVAANIAPDMFAIRDIKHELAKVRQAIWPMRDALAALGMMENWFDLEHRIFLRNALDHVMRLLDTLDSDRSLASDLMELAVAIANARLGDVTKVLTMIATIFIPITFIAGVYGMNFVHMPEIHWEYGYAFAWALMLGNTIVLLIIFWRRGWFSRSVLTKARLRAKRL